MLLARAYVDPNGLGLQGQSWGGYQIAYMITQTRMFSAAMAGAPVRTSPGQGARSAGTGGACCSRADGPPAAAPAGEVRVLGIADFGGEDPSGALSLLRLNSQALHLSRQAEGESQSFPYGFHHGVIQATRCLPELLALDGRDLGDYDHGVPRQSRIGG